AASPDPVITDPPSPLLPPTRSRLVRGKAPLIHNERLLTTPTFLLFVSLRFAA
ncbi:unnamed protein product, partial [Musa acuminata subsp. burmannicoides]